MLRQALEIIPHQSSQEPPFQSCLQPSRSEITSCRHLTLAHLPVHLPMSHALLIRSDSKITQQKKKLDSAPFLILCQTHSLWERLLLQQALINHQHPWNKCMCWEPNNLLGFLMDGSKK
ncbi:hypothetical protein ATANTOWER_011914 [Ataeniobius toweri]|uniref:Uncharacterized protein n=1 Tax=Ataeniobius toweri TaxID=208326 RepID=A0ABU7BS41_9TELE|nr:hypothetical protein [Ataeniobius toweri]